ncbi:MAG: GGDEF domain-containing protein [Nitrospirae bacterium]|nr:MAG: GGDEF domain-containing protein [Nitrospirota bacterium]
MANLAVQDHPQYDPQVLLNAQPVIIAVIDPASYKVQFQNQTSLAKFGNISNLTCHEKIASCAAPCGFCKMLDAIQSGKITSNEVPLPNDEYLLVQWSKAETADGNIHVVETITNITESKRQQKYAEALNQRLEEINEQLRDRAIRDGLTGLYNHSYFRDSLTHIFAQAKRAGQPLALLFVDLDNFKTINDSHGHRAGDQVLQGMGQLLSNQPSPGRERLIGRTSDLSARYGGEEFVVLLPGTPPEDALVMAELLRQRVMTLTSEPELADLVSLNLSLSGSIGVACFPDHADTPAKLIEAADQAAYAAKAAGKNCVKMYEPGAAPAGARSLTKRV